MPIPRLEHPGYFLLWFAGVLVFAIAARIGWEFGALLFAALR